MYGDGSEYMGWHSDDEKVYGKDTTICSISLGHSRDFLLREKLNHSNKLSYSLGNGDLFVMAGVHEQSITTMLRSWSASARADSFACVAHAFVWASPGA
jgi:alkylated DNA repair dioxygenase AlkB